MQLFNATSLKEAMSGMQLNRAIYMFTAVTIIYTPLSFIAVSEICCHDSASNDTGAGTEPILRRPCQAFWALPILNTTTKGDNMHPSVAALVATFVIIPIGTYVVCGCMAWHHAPSDAPVKKWVQKLFSRSSTSADSERYEKYQPWETTISSSLESF